MYPLYDRSGMDDDDAPLAFMEKPPAPVEAPPPPPTGPCTILVCEAGTCLQAGSEAVLLELEELANGLGCRVRPSGCLGACSEAPNAAVVRDGWEKVHTRLDSLESTVAVVKRATGREPDLRDEGLRARLTGARRLRMRKQAREEEKWNRALGILDEQLSSCSSRRERLELLSEQGQLLSMAGRWERALEVLSAVERACPQAEVVLHEKGKVLGKLGHTKELWEIIARMELAIASQSAIYELRRMATSAEPPPPLELRPIEGFATWSLVAITPVSRHSVVYDLSCSDRRRGTPFPRGDRWPKTWHSTLLAASGKNGEGPLDWVERDYTPVSNWKEWEKGTCRLLVKTYAGGAATTWLQQQPLGASVLLSRPRATLRVPGLLPSRAQPPRRRHASVLMVLGGTGIVAAPQLLHHADQRTCVGGAPALTEPLALVYACRRDDVLLLPELSAWCAAPRQMGRPSLARCVLAVSPAAGEAVYPDTALADLEEFRALPNAEVAEGRVTRELLARELAQLRLPCRALVSGPGPFNAAVQEMLRAAGLDSEEITVLAA